MSAHAARFHVPAGGPYLLSHSAGCLPRTAREQAERGVFAPWAQQGGEAWGDWLGAIEGFRTALAGLMQVEPGELCPQPGVSAGLSALLSGLRRAQGRDVLLLSAHSFPSIGYALTGLERLGFTVEIIPEDRDPADAQVWADAIDARVAAVIAMHVHSNTGRVAPVAEIARLARSSGALAVVDVAQSVGILPVAPRRWGVDAVVGSSLKWLCGGSGAGFLWVDQAIVTQFDPMPRGWFSHENPFEMDIRDFRYAPDARRFWGATPSVLPYAVATAGIAAISEIGVENALDWNRHLLARLSAAWEQPLDMARRGGTLCLAAGANADALSARLHEIGARFDRRGDTLRLSFHLWNSMEEAERVGQALRGTPATLA